MKILEDKTITDVKNIVAAGIHSGIRKSGKKDLCVIYSKVEAVSAAVFTTNKVKAAPLIVNMENIKSNNTQAIVANSGVANACTGEEGLQNAQNMVEITAECLNLSPKEVLVQSTGLIGAQLPMDIVVSGIKKVCSSLSEKGGMDAATAILTTDTCTKTITVQFEIDNKSIIMSGMAKGSGMIHPNMATMLGYIVTDAKISKEMLQKVLEDSVDKTYNMISVDGDTSTNDMVTVLANGCADNEIINSEDSKYSIFKKALDFVNIELSKMIAKDGEGATKLLEAKVLNAKTLDDARKCAKSVITSNLTKCALFGSDANWGRVMCSVGYSGADFIPEKVEIFFESTFGKIQVFKKGQPIEFDEDIAKKILLEDYIKIIVNLNDGEKSAVSWGCDLSYDYVKINGCYRT